MKTIVKRKISYIIDEDKHVQKRFKISNLNDADNNIYDKNVLVNQNITHGNHIYDQLNNTSMVQNINYSYDLENMNEGEVQNVEDYNNDILNVADEVKNTNMYDYYEDMLKEATEDNKLLKYINKNAKYYDENLLEDFLFNDSCDNNICETLICFDVYKENIKGISEKQKKNKNKIWDNNIPKISHIYFESSKEKYTYYFVPIPGIFNLFSH